MRHSYLFFLLLLVLVAACTTPDERDEVAPDFSNLITGTYSYKTYKNGSTTGSGTAIIAKAGSNKIQIGLEDGVSFYADKLQRIDNDMVMEVPSQKVNYYGLDANFAGARTISRQGSQYQGVFLGSKGELTLSLILTVGSKSDPITLVLDR